MSDATDDESVEANTQEHRVKLLADDPIVALDEDTLDRRPLADRIIDVLDTVREQTPTAVVGLLGAWGSGKTSLINLARGRAEQRGSAWRIVDFNPWLLTDVESLIRDFFAVLAEGLQGNRRQRKLKKRLAKYGATISPWLGALRVPGVDLGKAAKHAADMLAGASTVDSARREIEELLGDLDEPILVVVDDIDRLEPHELTTVFKLVRLVGRLPGVYYLLAFDEDTALDVLSASNIGHGDVARAHAYLEKIVQVRIDIPPLHQAAASKLVDSLLDAALAMAEVSPDDEENRRFADIYWSQLAPRMLQPRQLQRLFAQIYATLPLVDGEVNVVDFIVLTYIRTEFPRLFRALPSERDALTDSLHGAFLRRTQSAEERRNAWHDFVENHADPGDVDHLLELLMEIFPQIRSAAEAAGDTSSALSERRRAGASEYFDRYFQFGVPVDDVSDTAIRRALEALAIGSGKSSVEWLRTQVLEHRALALRKMHAQWHSDTNEAIGRLLDFLASVYPQVRDYRGEVMSPALQIELWVGELLSGIAVSADHLRETAQLKDGLRLLTRAVSLQYRLCRDRDEPVSNELAAAAVELGSELDAVLATAIQRPIADSEDLPWFLYYSTHFRDGEQVSNKLLQVLDSSAWKTRDLVGCFMSIAQTAGSPKRFLTDLATDELFTLIPMDEVFSRLKADLDDLQLENVSEPRDDPNTSFSHRVMRALTALRRLRSQYDEGHSG